ncbi:MAG: glutathione peroxidase [Alphaproteobacteria bacterium]
MSVLDHKAKMIDGSEVDLKQYEGKLVLVVNTASRCKLTPQLRDLEYLHKKYKVRGLVVLGFPCNQFANQENGEAHEIDSYYRGKFGVTFPIFDRVEVNGKDAHPFFEALRSKAKGFMGSTGIKWNFTKFLVAPNGKVERWASPTNPRAMEKRIEELLPEAPKADRKRPVLRRRRVSAPRP